ncbi:hypothetical protein PENSPDRAFT_642223, partial [Peniophora sp. CONT]
MPSPDTGNALESALEKVLAKYFVERSTAPSPQPITGKELESTLDKVLGKYIEERDELSRAKTSSDKFWGTYLRSMKDEDEALPKDWDGNTGSILTFTGLFAATVGAFLIASYPSLSDLSNESTMLLAEILAATKNTSTPAVEPFQVSTNAVIVNSLWFCSLLISLACALLATLVQDWSRNYTRDINRRTRLDESLFSRASNHVHIRLGVDRYHMGEVVNLIVTLVHLSVILFAAGLLVFLFPINSIVTWCTESVILIFMLSYLAISLLSILDTDCPYKTPLTYPL